MTAAALEADGLLLDMDGVLTMSAAPLPGAVAAFGRLRAAGLPVRLLTNTTAYTRAALGGALRGAGFAIDDTEILTVPRVAAAYLREHHPDARVFLLGDARHDDLGDLRLVELDDDPDVILVSGADASFAFDTLNGVYRALLAGAAFVAMHRNLAWMTRDGACLGPGAYLLGLERAAHRRPVVLGKPEPAFFRAGVASLGLPAGRVAMVGDDIEDDVLAAQAAGIIGVLVRTGKFRQGSLDDAPAPPDHVIDGITALPGLLGL